MSRHAFVFRLDLGRLVTERTGIGSDVVTSWLLFGLRSHFWFCPLFWDDLVLSLFREVIVASNGGNVMHDRRSTKYPSAI